VSKTSLVLTILGQDRPGLVGQVSELVAAHGGNWVESRMAHLAGQFAGILRVEIEAEQAQALTEALAALNNEGLDSVVHTNGSSATESDLPLVRLELVGHDRPGIIRENSRVLAAQGVNVEELTTECGSAPNTGQPLFRATATLRLPAGASESKLRQAMEDVAADMMVDISLES